MADYTTVAKVLASLPEGVLIDDETKPTAADVTARITAVSLSCDAAIAAGGGTVPPTGAILGRLEVLCTGEIAYYVMAVRSGPLGEDIEGTVWDRWHKDFNEALISFADEETSVAGGSTGNPSTGTVHEPWFTRDQVF
jgi:hypothetical protein